MNKTDLVTEEEAQVVERTVRVLNPSARVHRTQLSRVPLSQVMGTGLFDMREAEESAGWLRSLTEEVVPESEEYGIGSFVYRARAPFHPGRLAAFLESILMVVYIWDVYEVLLLFVHRQSGRAIRNLCTPPLRTEFCTIISEFNVCSWSFLLRTRRRRARRRRRAPRRRRRRGRSRRRGGRSAQRGSLT